jgi:meso-butanediol dehydrogenase/(S,S)-butanediol dehydrogenase/diacetyl reductase
MFTGKTAIVTGAGSGIGRAIAHAMAKRNAHTILVDINLESIEKVAREIEPLGHGKILVELSRYRGRIFPSPFMANIET